MDLKQAPAPDLVQGAVQSEEFMKIKKSKGTFTTQYMV